MMQFFCGLAFVASVAVQLVSGDFYSLEAKNRVDMVSLEEHKGKVSLVVNVASECGYTEHNYNELVKLQSDYEARDFTVLAFPCNQFGEQEPGTLDDIVKFAKGTYGANFPIFPKIDVHGKEISEVYEYLFKSTGSEPSWNFCKYLVDRSGEVVQFFSEKDSFSSVRQSVEYLLNKHTEL